MLPKRRFGRNKLLLTLGNKRIIEHVIDNVKSSKIKDIYLVYGNDQGEFEEIGQSKGIKLIHNRDYHLGQSSSVKKGIELIGDRYRGAMFLLGDQPFISSKTINLLLENFISNQKGIIVPSYQGKRGNPVIFSRDFFSAIKEIEGDRGARDIIKAHQDRTIYIPIKDKRENFDIDSEKDYHRALQIIKDYRGEGHC